MIGFHSMAHLKHFKELGEVYHSINILQKETYVWEQVLTNRGKWTEKELISSLDYINDIRVREYGLEPLNN